MHQSSGSRSFRIAAFSTLLAVSTVPNFRENVAAAATVFLSLSEDNKLTDLQNKINKSISRISSLSSSISDELSRAIAPEDPDKKPNLKSFSDNAAKLLSATEELKDVLKELTLPIDKALAGNDMKISQEELNDRTKDIVVVEKLKKIIEVRKKLLKRAEDYSTCCEALKEDLDGLVKSQASLDGEFVSDKAKKSKLAGVLAVEWRKYKGGIRSNLNSSLTTVTSKAQAALQLKNAQNTEIDNLEGLIAARRKK